MHNEKLFDHLFHLRLTEACNLTCDHCFIPKNPKSIDFKNVEDSVIRHIHRVTTEGDTVLLQFHGGEPTMYGVRRLRKVIEELKKDTSRKYKFSIQTNLINLSDELIELYHEYFDSTVGVSWDYKIRRLKGSNEDFEDVFWPNLEKLRAADIEVNLVVTTTRPFFEWFTFNGSDFLSRLLDLGINDLQLERLTKVGWARDNWEHIGMNNAEYSMYMTIFYGVLNTFLENTEGYLPVTPLSELEITMRNMLNGEGVSEHRTGCSSGVCDTRFHTIDANGYKIGCTALNSEYDNPKSSGAEIGIRFFSQEEILDAREQRVADCSGCEFNKICNTGCLSVTKLDHSMECSGAKNLLKSIKEKIKNENI